VTACDSSRALREPGALASWDDRRKCRTPNRACRRGRRRGGHRRGGDRLRDGQCGRRSRPARQGAARLGSDWRLVRLDRRPEELGRPGRRHAAASPRLGGLSASGSRSAGSASAVAWLVEMGRHGQRSTGHPPAGGARPRRGGSGAPGAASAGATGAGGARRGRRSRRSGGRDPRARRSGAAQRRAADDALRRHLAAARGGSGRGSGDLRGVAGVPHAGAVGGSGRTGAVRAARVRASRGAVAGAAHAVHRPAWPRPHAGRLLTARGARGRGWQPAGRRHLPGRSPARRTSTGPGPRCSIA
jgi:hypothetical protein